MSQKKGQAYEKVGRMYEKVVQRILELFYEEPSLKLTIRQVASRTKLPHSTVQYQLKALRERGVISENNQWIDSWQNKMKKSYYYLERIAQSGLIDYLEKELAASAIILFGSFRKGESVKGSDIDIFVEGAREKKMDLRSFEKELGHPIQLFVKPKITALPPHLLNNVVNGIKLKGYFTIK
ncbi:MAG: nucleotidyltransferase domain-containing protein [Nanoarchaeota archaeon]|nr:nucleotidyltransferase domain-containing protein [Nanoarchaeota archaeon]